MSTITDRALFNTSTLIAYTGTYSASQGTQDLSPQLKIQNAYISTVSSVDFQTTRPVTLGFNTYYKMQGFNNTTGQYEVWHSVGTPILNPPSTNKLVNIEIIYSWIDR